MKEGLRSHDERKKKSDVSAGGGGEKMKNVWRSRKRLFYSFVFFNNKFVLLHAIDFPIIETLLFPRRVDVL